MERYLKITIGLLLFVQALHRASLQSSTDSPGRTIDPSWLRQPAKKKTDVSQNPSVTEEEAQYEQGSDGMASGSNDSEVIPSGFMSVRSEEENNVIGQDYPTSRPPLELTAASASPTFPSTLQTEQPNAAVSPNTTAAAAPGDSSRINGTQAEEGLPDSKKNRGHPTDETSHNLTHVPVPLTPQTDQPNATISPNTAATTAPGGDSSRINGTEAEDGLPTSTAATSQLPTTPPSKTTSSSFPDNSNATGSQTTTSAAGGDGTQGPSAKPEEVPRLPNATEATNATTATATRERGTTTAPAAAITPERANGTDPDAATASSSERGLSKDGNHGRMTGSWGAVLGVGVAVALIALVAYVILKKRFGTDFSHRKLVEEYPSDPVLRLDNGPPLDLDFGLGGSAYYNPGLQKDNIQMDNIPGRR